MDKERIGALAARGRQIKTNTAEYLWVCRGIRPLPLPDKPAPIDPSVDPDHLQRQPRQVNAPHLK